MSGSENGTPGGLLADLRVVECASFIAAPSCALHLAQLGAQVLRIDPIGGGPDFRRWPLAPSGGSYYWEGLNKGKQSVAVDFSRPEGRAIALELITAMGGPSHGSQAQARAQANIFVTNFPRDGFLAHERLAARRPELITVRVMGFADGGSAVDYTVNAAVGVPLMTGPASLGPAPVNHVLPAWDLITGAYAAFAALAAERERLKTGFGQEVTVPLADVAMAALGHTGLIAQVLQSGSRPREGNVLFGAFGRDFFTACGQPIMLVAITARQWKGLVQALALGQAISALEAKLGLSFAQDEGLRYVHREALHPLFEQAIGQLALADLAPRLDAHEVCWSPYRTLEQALAQDPRLALAAPLFQSLLHPSGQRYPAPGPAAHFAAGPPPMVRAAPQLGQHTRQVLGQWLGYGRQRIDQLHEQGLVASAPQAAARTFKA